MMIKRNRTVAFVLVLTLGLALSACGSDNVEPNMKTSGGVSAVQSIDELIAKTTPPLTARKAALLGIFVSEYLTTVSVAMAAESALHGVDAQKHIIQSQQTIDNPDYDLLQAFGDALQVDVADLLNRSTDRQKTLDTYSEALTNVATRANDRFKELKSQLAELKKLAATQKKDQSNADRDLKKAIKDKNFDDAGEKQKTLTERQAAFAETDVKRKQIQSLYETLNDLLTLYGRKILAIQQNREALIAGVKVVDVPGAVELQVLDKRRAQRSPDSRSVYDALFADPIVQ